MENNTAPPTVIRYVPPSYTNTWWLYTPFNRPTQEELEAHKQAFIEAQRSQRDLEEAKKVQSEKIQNPIMENPVRVPEFSESELDADGYTSIKLSEPSVPKLNTAPTPLLTPLDSPQEVSPLALTVPKKTAPCNVSMSDKPPALPPRPTYSQVVQRNTPPSCFSWLTGGKPTQTSRAPHPSKALLPFNSRRTLKSQKRNSFSS